MYFRYSGLLSILCLILLSLSTMMSMMAEITVLHWLLVASLVHMLAGLVLAMSLVIFLSTVVFEFSSTSVVQVPSGFLYSYQILNNNNCHFFFQACRVGTAKILVWPVLFTCRLLLLGLHLVLLIVLHHLPGEDQGQPGVDQDHPRPGEVTWVVDLKYFKVYSIITICQKFCNVKILSASNSQIQKIIFKY